MRALILASLLFLAPATVAISPTPAPGLAEGAIDDVGSSRLCRLPEGPAVGHLSIETPDGYHWLAELTLAVATCSPPVVATCGAWGSLELGLGFACNSPLPSFLRLSPLDRCVFPLPAEPPAAMGFAEFDDETLHARGWIRMHLLGEADAQVPPCGVRAS